MSEHMRIRAVARLVQDRGMDREDADLIALALIPLDEGPEGAPNSRRFPKRVARRTQRFRKAARTVSGEELVDLARDAIEDYCDLAVVHGEDYYIAKFEEATAGPAPWATRSATIPPEARPASEGAKDHREEHAGSERR